MLGWVAVVFGLLGEGEGGDGVLADGFVVGVAEVGVAVADDLSHSDLGEFFWDHLGVEQAAFQGGAVLDEGGDDFVEVFAADAGGFGAFGGDEAFDFHVEHAALLVEADVGRVNNYPKFGIGKLTTP